MHSQTEQTGEESKTEPSSPEFASVTPDTLGAVWPLAAPYIARGLRHGQGADTTLELIHANLVLGHMRMALASIDGDVMGGCIFSTRQTGNGQKLWVDMVFGKHFELWVDGIMEKGDEIRKELGLRTIEASCRIGLEKFLKRHGWRTKAVIMEF